MISSDRIFLAMKRAGIKSGSELARKARLNETTVRTYISGTRQPPLDVCVKLGKALDVRARWLFDGTPPMEIDDKTDPLQEPSVTPIPLSRLVPYVVSGTVEAGAFREVWEFDQSDPEVLYLEPDPDYPQARRFAAIVAGDSMDDLRPIPIFEGSKVVGISYEDVAGRLPLTDGLVVVVQRERDGGHLREWSVKQITIEGNDIVFNPRSRNPRHKPFKVPTTFDSDDGQAVEIIAVVRGMYNKIGM